MLLKEESLIGHTNIDTRLVVTGGFQLSQRVVRLDGYLRCRIIVHTTDDIRTFGIVIGSLGLRAFRYIRVILLIASKDIKVRAKR